MNAPGIPHPLPEDLRVFLTMVRKASFSGAADTLGLSPAYVSKPIQVLEPHWVPVAAPHHAPASPTYQHS